MEHLPIDGILKFHPDTLQAVRKVYGLDKPGAMSEAIDILDTWVKQQNHHVKKNYSRDYLERLIITTKGSVQRAKERLDRICTLRTLMPHYFGDFKFENFKELDRGAMRLVILPEMTKDNYRVCLVKLTGDQFDSKYLVNAYNVLFVFAEYLRAHDYVSGMIFVADYRDVSLTKLIAVMNPFDLSEGLTITTQGYGIRIKGIYMLTESKLIDGMITLLKQVLSAKVSERISVHRTLESLHTVVPQDIFPKEYGGKERPLEELHNDWLKAFSTEKYKEYQREMNAARTDESLRQTDTFNEQYMGMPGTFRTLRVD